jgi:hypothetical protein
MPTQITDLFLFEDLEDVERTSELAESDLDALHAVADDVQGGGNPRRRSLRRRGDSYWFWEMRSSEASS